MYTYTYMMQKPLSAIWNFLLKLAFLSGSNEKNLFIAIKVKLLNLHIGV